MKFCPPVWRRCWCCYCVRHFSKHLCCRACNRLVDCFHNAQEKEQQWLFVFFFTCSLLHTGGFALDLGFYDNSTSCHTVDRRC